MDNVDYPLKLHRCEFGRDLMNGAGFADQQQRRRHRFGCFLFGRPFYPLRIERYAVCIAHNQTYPGWPVQRATKSPARVDLDKTEARILAIPRCWRGATSEMCACPGGGTDVLIYVHGFNQTFETAALDAAQLSDAFKFRGRTMVFSWPSKAGLFDYAYDRDSAMFSRDDFEHVLSSIVSAPSASRVHIVAHSMGTMLALESLRQLYARYGDTVNGRIGAVVFAAPDIDMDVFSSAITRIGPLAGKITVIASTNDRALALSGQLAGGMTRVGAAEKAAIERLGVRVNDASDTGWGIINHDLFLSNEEVQRVIRRSIDAAAT